MGAVSDIKENEMLQLGFPAFLSLVGSAYIVAFQGLTPVSSLGLWMSAKMYMDRLDRLVKLYGTAYVLRVKWSHLLRHWNVTGCGVVRYICGHRHRTTTWCYFHCMKMDGLWAKNWLRQWRESETEFHYSWRVAHADQVVKLNDVDVDRRGLHVALDVTVLLVIVHITTKQIMSLYTL